MPHHLPALLRRAAERFPDRLAAELDGRSLTYAQLDAESNRLARALVGGSVGPGRRVGLWLPKSLQAIASIWAVLKTGAAYVPLDPNAPPARALRLLGNAEVTALITHRPRLELLGPEALPPSTRSAWCVDGFLDEGAPADREPPTPVTPAPSVPRPNGDRWDRSVGGLGQTSKGPSFPDFASALAAQSDAPLLHDLDDRAPAYVLFTSGSTGEPKGVVVSHRASRAFVDWAAGEYLVPDDRLAGFAPFHFDLSTFDLFAAAAAGACVHPVPPRAAAFPVAVARFVASSRLSVWYATPSLLALLLAHGLERLDVSALRVLLFAGEVMPPAVLRRLMALAPRARFANLYGPTETNVCTHFEVRSPPSDEPLPIGVASPTAKLAVLDDAGSPVAPGEPGELWVGGQTLFDGYFGQPDRTAESVRELETRAGRERHYRTGDRVRERPDGALEFLGRRDEQVKVRGHRVELGELDQALRSHPEVAEAVAVAIPDALSHRLMAAVVLQAGSLLTVLELRRHLAAILPGYLVPERIYFQAALPLTTSGKLDRRAVAASLASMP